MEDQHVAEMTEDEIESWLTASERVIAQIRGRQITLLRHVAVRQIPLGDGCRSLAEWAAGRMDLTASNARTLTTTARRLADLPILDQAIGDGDLTFDRAVEIARLATPSTQIETLEATESLDISAVKRRVAKQRHITPADERQIAEAEHVVIRPNLDESRWDIWGTLSGYSGRIVDKALTSRADELPTPPDTMRHGIGKRQADALVSVCQDSLTGSADGPDTSTPLVSVFVDATSAGPSKGQTAVVIENGPRVGPITLERILCEGAVEIIARTADGQALAVGQASRALPPKLRRFVLARDGGCVADGCDSRYRLQPHHRVPYAISRNHDPTNLCTLCWWHHHVVIHQLGYTIDPRSPAGRIRFVSPGRAATSDPPGSG